MSDVETWNERCCEESQDQEAGLQSQDMKESENMLKIWTNVSKRQENGSYGFMRALQVVSFHAEVCHDEKRSGHVQ